jgi:predicted TPR repeat methyltransferase
MTAKTPGQELLESAYDLATPADSQRFYDAFAPTYDADFVETMGYQYPAEIAQAYRRHATPNDLPVADVGCGTGIIATTLGLPPDQIDGMDISPQMLAVARTKLAYAALFEFDLTGPLDAHHARYGAVLSAGTFTHGHLGPEPLANLLQIARPNALFIIGVNQAHFISHNFAAVLDALRDTNRITPYKFDEIKMYAKSGHAHSDDRALILQYRKV